MCARMCVYTESKSGKGIKRGGERLGRGDEKQRDRGGIVD